ncbi:MAG: PTS transporter subunit EIIC [Mycoplasmatales bacterium]|nr:PTS transporter subunit EIIC [Mycoplasmatales bacterium]
MSWKQKKAKVMASLSKLSKAFMLPIALLPVAGLFLGVGTTIVGQSMEYSGIWWFGRVLRTTGNIPFQNLPALFAVSVAIAFTKDAGVAGLTAIIAWLVFNMFMAAFMRQGVTEWRIVADFKLNWKRFPNNGASITGVANTDFKNFVFTMKNHGYIPPYDTTGVTVGGFGAHHIGMKDILAQDLSARFGTTIHTSDITVFDAKTIEKMPLTYDLWFWKGAIGVTPSIVTPILGIGAQSGMGQFGGALNTGVFGGIAVGALVATIYNKFYKIQLPKFIAFFGGVRAVPIIAFIAVLPLSAIFIILWPGFGSLLTEFGKWSGSLPGGLDSFVFGFAKRALIPFGLHHVFYAPLWWTSAGGQISDFVSAADVKSATTLTAQGDQSAMMAVLADGKLKVQDVWAAGLHIGRFQSGEFAIMMFALPATAIAMWLTVPKQNRKAAMGIYFSAALTSFLTGITEPLEFTFLFVSPALYYLVHVPIFASSYLLANVTGIKIGMTFSGGMLDWIIFGIVPSINGHDTKWWLVPIEGLGYAVVEATLFYWIIKWKDIQLPGRTTGEMKLYTKADVRGKNGPVGGEPGNDSNVPGGQRTLDIIRGLGGVDNLDNIDACATRLRVAVKNPKKVQVETLKGLGAVAVIISGNGTQSIFGGEADIIKTNIKEYIEKQKSEQSDSQVKKAVS